MGVKATEPFSWSPEQFLGPNSVKMLWVTYIQSVWFGDPGLKSFKKAEPNHFSLTLCEDFHIYIDIGGHTGPIHEVSFEYTKDLEKRPQLQLLTTFLWIPQKCLPCKQSMGWISASPHSLGLISYWRWIALRFLCNEQHSFFHFSLYSLRMSMCKAFGLFGEFKGSSFFL
jgi:hypothetical protein